MRIVGRGKLKGRKKLSFNHQGNGLTLHSSSGLLVLHKRHCQPSHMISIAYAARRRHTAEEQIVYQGEEEKWKNANISSI